MADVFEKRIRRAEQLAKEWPFAEPLLGFFRRITEFQKDFARIDARKPDLFDTLGDRLSSFCGVVERFAPPPLAAKAGEVRGWSARRRRDLLTFTSQRGELPAEDPLEDWLARTILGPWSMGVADDFRPHLATAGKLGGRCPCCAHLPQVSVLREDKSADTVRRSLICSFCSFEWDLPRVLCPSCDEEQPEKLPRYTAQEIPWMRVEACDSCRKYLKSVDLTQNWEAEPVVDELASTPLDVIAREHGYEKIAPNLAGI